MDRQQLIYFLRVCTLQSFSMAAKSLYISQQGLSKSIKALEDELQTTLFIRKSTGIELTHSAQVLQEKAAGLLQHHDDLLRCMREVRESEVKKLAIGHAAGSFDLLPYGFLTDFMRLHPQVDISLKSFDSEQYRSDVLNHGIDVSICPIAYDANLFDALLVFKRSFALIMAKDHPLAAAPSIRLQDLRQHKTGFLSSTQEPGSWISNMFHKKKIQPQILLSPSETTLLGELASRGGIIFFFAGRMQSLPDNLVMRNIEDFQTKWPFYFLTSKNAHITQAMRDFIDYVHLRLEQDGIACIRP